MGNRQRKLQKRLEEDSEESLNQLAMRGLRTAIPNEDGIINVSYLSYRR
jgi:hypothetical protein